MTVHWLSASWIFWVYGRSWTSPGSWIKWVHDRLWTTHVHLTCMKVRVHARNKFTIWWTFMKVSFVVTEYSWTVHEHVDERSWTFIVFCSRTFLKSSWSSHRGWDGWCLRLCLILCLIEFKHNVLLSFRKENIIWSYLCGNSDDIKYMTYRKLIWTLLDYCPVNMSGIVWFANIILFWVFLQFDLEFLLEITMK